MPEKKDKREEKEEEEREEPQASAKEDDAAEGGGEEKKSIPKEKLSAINIDSTNQYIRKISTIDHRISREENHELWKRVKRGGSWSNYGEASKCRSAWRASAFTEAYIADHDNYFDNGFRIAFHLP